MTIANLKSWNVWTLEELCPDINLHTLKIKQPKLAVAK